MNQSISIIIPNYNGAEILTENLPVVYEYTRKYNTEIILVDDASTDHSIDTLQKMPQISIHPQKIAPMQHPDLKLQKDKINVIQKTINQGFSSTVNLGVCYASGDYICLLNSDVIPSLNFLEPVLPHFEKNLKLFAIGLKDLSDDQAEHGRGKFIFHRGFLLHQRLESQNNSLASGPTGWVSCGSGVFVKKIWDELGGLDELLNPFYFEDVDLGYRAWKAGYELYFESQAIVEHIHKKGSIKSNYNEDRIKTISYRNQFIFNWKNLTDKSLITRHLLKLPKNIIIEAKNGNTPFFKGLLSTFLVLNKVFKNRKFINSLSKLSDAEVFTQIQS